ncbi:hypothetical protein D1007_50444 [Hordeum vulgare]|nr:hypothetical protein D1007_50444 [Hordeum vulgare]
MVNPYDSARVHFPGGEMFWSQQEYLIYEDVIKTKKNMYVPVQWVDMNHIKKDPAYFGEALDMVEQLHIEELITFHHDFDPEIVAQFFLTFHFHPDDDRTMTWMTNGEQLSATWKEFMALLHVHDEGLEHSIELYFRALAIRTRCIPTWWICL